MSSLTHTEWVEEVEKEVNRLTQKKLKKTNEAWLYREAYYDDYDLHDAVALALNDDQQFGATKNGWGPK